MRLTWRVSTVCPSLSPPGFFDFLAPHSSGLTWAWWLAPPLVIFLLVTMNRRLLSRLPDGPERPSIARLFGLQAGFISAGMTLAVLALLWGDAANHWFRSLPSACTVHVRYQDVMSPVFHLSMGLVLAGCLIAFVGVIILAIASSRYQRILRATRVIL